MRGLREEVRQKLLALGYIYLHIKPRDKEYAHITEGALNSIVMASANLIEKHVRMEQKRLIDIVKSKARRSLPPLNFQYDLVDIEELVEEMRRGTRDAS